GLLRARGSRRAHGAGRSRGAGPHRGLASRRPARLRVVPRPGPATPRLGARGGHRGRAPPPRRVAARGPAARAAPRDPVDGTARRAAVPERPPGRRRRRRRMSLTTGAAAPSAGEKTTRRMTAAVLVAPGRVELAERPRRPPAPGEIEIRLEGCGVCG